MYLHLFTAGSRNKPKNNEYVETGENNEKCDL